jgi:CTP-dependent riboflavin kinase
MDNGVIKVSINGNDQSIVNNFNDIPKDANGIRTVYLRDLDKIWHEKTIFPDEWSRADIISGIAEASKQKLGNSQTQFAKIVTKNGKSVNITGTVINGIIKTGYPNTSYPQD